VRATSAASDASGVPAEGRDGLVIPAVPIGGGLAYRAAKRALDITVAGLVLLVALPFLAVFAVLIKLDSPGPVIYAAPRVGRRGRTFPCFKLRTMRADADDTIHREYLQHLITNSHAAVATRLPDDPRITRVGRWLRKSSLDELPQLWNVLRGDMSLIGPRPPIPYEVDCYQPWHLGRLAVRPGITGYWQVLARGRVTFDEMCRMDLDYIARRSLGLDLWILWRSPAAVASRRGAG